MRPGTPRYDACVSLDLGELNAPDGRVNIDHAVVEAHIFVGARLHAWLRVTMPPRHSDVLRRIERERGKVPKEADHAPGGPGILR